MFKFILYLIFIFFYLIFFKNIYMIMNMFMLMILMFMFLNMNYLFMNSIAFYLSYDILSFGLILLSMWICMLMIQTCKFNNFMFLLNLILLLLFLIMTFISMNLFFFYFFFESSLIPIMIMILGWGYQYERMNAMMYLMMYTLFASLPLMLSIFYLMKLKMLLIFLLMKNYTLNNMILMLSMIFAFLFKMPMFFIHLWLPKAHVEAPVFGSMILAGVLLKLGGYGLIRIINLFKMSILEFNYLVISINLIGGIFMSLICYYQIDMKMLIAYSSVVHMSLLICGLFTLNLWSINGAYTLMIGHGLCSSGLFYIINMIYERTNTRNMILNKSMINFMPNISFWWFLLLSSNMAAPFSMNLFGEISLIHNLLNWSFLNLIFLMLFSLLSVGYSLYLFINIQHGKMNIFKFQMGNMKEYLLLMLHWIPLNLMFIKMSFFMLIF
uniref:NADH-ubiquinone oxidoreductase chain 4 n=1 Tax=Micropterix calthella TaxID=41027 RepID=A0A076EBC5_9NEOP|nr:NADH dehydrogenase subunit 4 [Micropterix calthella]